MIPDARALATGFSSCPNDTFMFHGLVTGEVAVPGLRFTPEIGDIEALNLRALDRERALPITKISASALAQVSDRYTVLGAGAALGRGCGPLIVAREGGPGTLAALAGRSLAIPGEHTTAHLLARIFAPGFRAEIMRFDQIMPALAAGRVDAGLIIHESRFTYADFGLVELADLGECWERSTGLPIPLGMIAARRELGAATIEAVEEGLRRSVALAFAEPARSWPWIRAHAQELDEAVCRKHIALYVNDFSVALGDEGKAAIDALFERGRASGFLPPGPSPWR